MNQQLDLEHVGLHLLPICYAELVLCFDHDFSVDELDSKIGLNATEKLRQANTRINPFSGENNPGYWLYRTNSFLSDDIRMLSEELTDLLERHFNEFQTVIEQYHASVFFVRLRVEIKQEDAYPSLRFSPSLLNRISSLGAYMDIEIANDFID